MLKNYRIVLLLYVLNSVHVQAQSPLCVGSTSVPVLLETFGAGPNPGPALPSGLTNYPYVTTWPVDGRYTIANTSTFMDNPGPAYWQASTDHTGDPNGYMMVVNADAAPGEFYRKKITGLCPNTTYIFSTWAANVNTQKVHSYCDPNYIFPDILFKIEDQNGVILGSKASGKIQIDTTGLVWREYGFKFSSNNQSSVNLVMVNNAPGGCGNDLVLDDISFYICNPILNPVTNPSKSAYCIGENVTILGGLGPGYTNPQFQWQFSGDAGITWNDIPGETNLNLVLNNLTILPIVGQYRLMVSENGNITSPTCRIISPSVSITVVPPPSVSVTPNNVACNGGNNGSASANPSGGTQPYTYAWSTIPISTTQNISGLAPGIYSVTVTDKYGCKNSSTTTITQPTTLLLTTASQATVSCNGGSNGSASVKASGGTPNYSYLWNTGKTTSSITGITVGNYSVKVTDAKGCTATHSINITQPNNPISLAITGDDSICHTEISILNTTVTGGTPAYTYLWMPGSYKGKSISVSPASSTTYSVTVTDANGCSSGTKNFNVLVLPDPVALFDTISSGFYNSSYTFSDLSSGATSLLWNFGDGTTSTIKNPTHMFPGVGIYDIKQIAYSKFGCRDTFNIIIFCKEQILVPNVFTPDGDGTNDFWYIPNSGMQEFHVEIFDRWGLKLFETTSDKIKWDGRTNSGKPVPEGTYFFVLKAMVKSINGIKDYSTTGNITLLTGRK